MLLSSSRLVLSHQVAYTVTVVWVELCLIYDVNKFGVGDLSMYGETMSTC